MRTRKITKAVHTGHDITKPPRIMVGSTSAEKTGTVTSFRPMPIPRSIRHATSWPHDCVQAEPIGAKKEKMAARKMVSLRPITWLMGSESQPALEPRSDSAQMRFPTFHFRDAIQTHMMAMQMYGVELT